MKKRGFRVILLIFFLSVLAANINTVSASNIYNTYTYSNNGDIEFSPDIYGVERILYGSDFGTKTFIKPTDMCVDDDGNLYILDGGSNSVFFISKTLDKAKKITKFYKNGEVTSINEPTGISIDRYGYLYICDGGNHRIIRTDKDGNIQLEVTKPKSDFFSKDVDFIPKKLVVDSALNLYVSCIGISQGLVLFDRTGEFQGFYGAPKVETTSKVLSDYFWKLFMTEEAKQQMAAYVPPEVANLCITKDDFIATITNSYYSTENQKMDMDIIRLLNPKGTDILPSTLNSGFVKEAKLLNFTDVCIDNNGFMTLLDNRKDKIYQFDSRMNLIAAFSAKGSYAGTFLTPVAIAAYGSRVFVLDSSNCSVTVFQLTDYGEKIHHAINVYNTEKQSEAIEPWREVLQLNTNYDLAYVGIGNVLLNQGDYSQAMEYFKLGHDSIRYNDAFKEFRIMFLRSHSIAITVCIVVLLVIWRVTKIFRKKIRISRLKSSIDREDTP